MEGLWFLIAIALLRFVWRFIERSARQAGEADPAERLEERKAKRERRRGRTVSQPRPERSGSRFEPVPSPADRRREPAPRRRPEPQRPRRAEPATYTPAEARRPNPRNDLLERLREVMEGAAGTRPTPQPPQPVPVPIPAPETHRPPPAPEGMAPRDTKRTAVEPEPDVATTVARASSRARDLRHVLREPASLREVILLREIFGPPVAHRRAPQARHRM